MPLKRGDYKFYFAKMSAKVQNKYRAIAIPYMNISLSFGGIKAAYPVLYKNTYLLRKIWVLHFITFLVLQRYRNVF
jgi:hypothetical protein